MRRAIVCLALWPIVISLLGATCRHEVYSPPEKPLKMEIQAKLDVYIRQDIHIITGNSPPGKAGPGALPEEESKKETPPVPEGKESKAANVLLRLLGVGSAHAAAASDEEQLNRVRTSMQKRYPTLVRYKADKSIGENHGGLLAERPSPRMSDAKYARAVRAVVAAENADRRVLYQIRARVVGTTPEKVAAGYAKTWRDIARRGEWIEVLINKRWVWIQKK